MKERGFAYTREEALHKVTGGSQKNLPNLFYLILEQARKVNQNFSRVNDKSMGGG
jgi:hypothetical protein